MMNTQMFCFQCEQTAGCKGCTGAAGVCGKKADVAGLQDQLTGALIGLARATAGNTQPSIILVHSVSPDHRAFLRQVLWQGAEMQCPR